LTVQTEPRAVLWLRARSGRAVLAEHLLHVAGSFEAAGWTVATDEGAVPPAGGVLAVMADPWVEPLPKLAWVLAAANVPGAPAWRVPLVWGLRGTQGWRDRVPPASMREYEQRTVTSRRGSVVPLGREAWCGFAVAAPGQAAALLSGGWPPERAALVVGTRLFRYSDPSAHERRELLPYVPASARRVIDVGCGSGLFGGILRAAGKTVVGIEPEWELARLARARLDLVLPVSGAEGLKALRLPVDCVVLADVVEHTSPPQHLLRAAGEAVKHREGGRVIVSFPSAAWAPVVRALAAGRWDNTLAGVQARDHLFYTTPRSFAAIAGECGLAVERLEPLGVAASFRERLWAWLAAITAGGTPSEMAAPQWVAVLRPR
jgi:2-polyprenyl-3-methyl-5-hydroxy-6-metoxy-1,4-benzoquinol methylase